MLSPVEQIKDRLDIVDLVGSYIKLDKAGRNYKARCPFHNEKTPSFIVSPDRQNFYCFGCQAHGDVFSFVEKFEGLEFKEALKVLAERTGVELKNFKKEDESKKDRLLKANEEATRFYEKHLENSEQQKKYLEERGVTNETKIKWRIGSAPLEWRVLMEHLILQGFSKQELLEAGLIKKAEGDEEKYYDVFRGRIMFPIFDISGRVIAFSGRIFVDDGKSPKYVNSPETDLFIKSEVLYGMHEAKTEVRRLDYFVLVEGQVDLVLSHQAGVKNTVATSGTALTESHLKRLSKLTHRCIFAYDSDEAGRSAVRRSGELALSLGMEIKIARLREGEDPASIIQKNPEEWKEILKTSVSLVEFAIEESLRKSGSNKSALVKEVSKSILPLLARVESAMQLGEMMRLTATKTSIAEKDIWTDLEKFKKISKKESSNSPLARTSIEPLHLSQEELLVGILLAAESGAFTGNSFNSDEIKGRLQKLFGREALSEMVENARVDKDTLIFETENRLQGLDPMKAATELLMRIEKGVLENRLSETARLIDKAKGNKSEAERLRTEEQEILKRLSEIAK